LGIKVSARGDGQWISLEGVIDIASAAELKAALLKAFAAGQGMHVSMMEAGSLDVTAFQLLWAAKREAKRLDVEFDFAGQPLEAILGLAASMGLEGIGLFE
jgi:anti-anti-sigma regulatory factor